MQVEGFKTVVEKAAKIGSSVIGRGTIINLISCQNFKCLVEFKDSKEFMFSNFTIMQSTFPLFKIVSSKKVLISDLLISNSSLTNGTSLIAFMKSNVVIKNVTVKHSSFNHSFLIKIDKSKVVLSESCFFQNFIFHKTENPFIALRNSTLSVQSTKLLRSTSHNSPFMTTIDKSKVRFVNTTFEEETHKEMIKAITEDNEVIFDNCSFISCYGHALLLGGCSTGRVSNTLFDHNFAPSEELFNVLSSASLAVAFTTFSSNSGIQLVTSSGNDARISIESSNFVNNKVSSYIIQAKNNSSIEITNASMTNNFAGNYIIASDESSLSIKESSIFNNTANIISSTNRSSTTIEDCKINTGSYFYKSYMYYTSDAKPKLVRTEVKESEEDAELSTEL